MENEIYLIDNELDALSDKILVGVESIEDAIRITNRIEKRITHNKSALELNLSNEALANLSIYYRKEDAIDLGIDSNTLSFESHNDPVESLMISIEEDKGLLTRAWDAIKKFFKNLWNNVVKFFNKILEALGLKKKRSEELEKVINGLEAIKFAEAMKVVSITDAELKILEERFCFDIIDGWKIPNYKDYEKIISNKYKKIIDDIDKFLSDNFLINNLDKKSEESIVKSPEKNLKNYTQIMNHSDQKVRLMYVYGYRGNNAVGICNYVTGGKNDKIGSWKNYTFKNTNKTVTAIMHLVGFDKEVVSEYNSIHKNMTEYGDILKKNISSIEKKVERYKHALNSDKFKENSTSDIQHFMTSYGTTTAKMLVNLGQNINYDIDSLNWFISTILKHGKEKK